MREDLPSSPYYHLKDIAPGVYVALARPQSDAGSNSAIIDLGNRTVMIDAFTLPQAAAELRDTAKLLTGHAVDLVLLTHHHLDHIWGCQAFSDDVCLFSSEDTLHKIIEAGPVDIENNRKGSQEALRQAQENLKSASSQEQRAQIEEQIAYARKSLAVIESIKIRLPNMTSQGPVSFYGTRRSLEFLPQPHAHAPGNAIIRLPQENIVFVGDLLFTKIHPYTGDADIAGWIDVLEKIVAMQPEQVVPGHGPLSQAKDLQTLADYFRLLTEKVQAFVQAGKPANALAEIEVPEPYASWEPKFFLEKTLDGLYGRYKE